LVYLGGVAQDHLAEKLDPENTPPAAGSQLSDLRARLLELFAAQNELIETARKAILDLQRPLAEPVDEVPVPIKTGRPAPRKRPESARAPRARGKSARDAEPKSSSAPDPQETA
jgi:hypothetical protein